VGLRLGDNRGPGPATRARRHRQDCQEVTAVVCCYRIVNAWRSRAWRCLSVLRFSS